MMRFYPLKISEVRRETPSAVSIAFEVPPRYKRYFQFTQGQYLTLRTPIDGREIRRAYSICSGVGEDELRIAIKRVEGGRFSSYATETLRAGQTIDVMTPHGRFYIPVAPDAARRYILCATGSGITPLLSILKTVLAAEPGSRIALFYGNKNTNEILFRTELQALEQRYAARLKVYHFLSREPALAPALGGRLDARVPALAEAVLGDIRSVDACFMCGLIDMTTTLADELTNRGVPKDRIHVELFDGPAGEQPLPDGVEKDATAVLLSGGNRIVLKLGTATVLDAALEAGVDLPYSCRIGSCSTCVAKVLEGRAHMAANNALDAKAVEKGYVLSCQTRALTQQLVLDCEVGDITP